ncbi:aspartate aminotransferase family protein [Picrophilus oshimae]|uniref:Acetylornithine aminotransferase n=1 Tax=Picrophilus torridus (strain ATCC 700027 / DSM 9790 / JCM 10055 / NBRC 100828 / KAW 2/3) TaxID=1122961 RepID=Q6KYZ7_PICTO|nr:aminotransferase class III-fold pyridoxal phosphate-dependent enzyme [Picrophilus oshimae]AAT44055.1 acetylornithine aminotransferase [Picrophilus oshimae DSM 9789]SMD30874.1 acetylornithine aminotransferase apoenzyme [Picrophilus oshimae DSM 9789]
MNYEDDFIANTYQKLPVDIEYGEDSYLIGSDNKRYIDLMSGYGVAILGYSNKHVKDSITDQLNKIPILHASEYNKTRSDFVEKLHNILPGKFDKMYLGNTGAEAIEAAIKAVIRSTGRRKIIAMTGSYHGKTLGALSITHSLKYRKPFMDLLNKNVDFIKYNDVNDLDKIDDDTAAVFFEPVQGESGINIPDKSYVIELRKVTERHGTALVADEIQSGLGRTGTMWAFENFGIVPDIITIGKGIGGGIPLSVTAGKSEFMMLEKGDQSSTTGGNPIACAAGSAVIDELKPELIRSVRHKGELFRSMLNNDLNGLKVKEIRGLGLMNAVELRIRFLPVLLNMINNGVISLYSGISIIRMLPPYIIKDEDLEMASKIIASSIREAEENWQSQ